MSYSIFDIKITFKFVLKIDKKTFINKKACHRDLVNVDDVVIRQLN